MCIETDLKSFIENRNLERFQVTNKLSYPINIIREIRYTKRSEEHPTMIRELEDIKGNSKPPSAVLPEMKNRAFVIAQVIKPQRKRWLLSLYRRKMLHLVFDTSF